MTTPPTTTWERSLSCENCLLFPHIICYWEVCILFRVEGGKGEFSAGEFLRILMGILSESSIMEIRDIGMLKYFFSTRGRSALNHRAELWGFDKGGKFRKNAVEVCKHMLGLNNKLNGSVLRGDTGIKCPRQSRFISMVKYWESVTLIEGNRLVKQAFLVMLQDRRKDSWPTQVKNILDYAGKAMAGMRERG